MSRAPGAEGTLVFGVALGGAPYTYADPKTGQPIGIDVDLAKAAAERLGMSLEIRVMNFQDLIPSVKAGTLDFAGAAITITPNRARDVDFTDSYAFDGSAFLSRAGEPMMTIPRALSARVGTQKASLSLFYLCNHRVDPVTFLTYEEAFQAFQEGRLDAVFYDAEPIRQTVAASNGAYVISPLETRERYGLAVRKDYPELRVAANAVIAARKERP